MSRLEFTSKTMREAWSRSGGICECHLVPMLKRPKGCGAKLTDGNVRYEHIIPDNFRPDNSLSNCAALSKTCWREKTSTYDLPTIAKAKRVGDRAKGIRKQTSRPLRSRGFERRVP